MIKTLPTGLKYALVFVVFHLLWWFVSGVANPWGLMYNEIPNPSADGFERLMYILVLWLGPYGVVKLSETM